MSKSREFTLQGKQTGLQMVERWWILGIALLVLTPATLPAQEEELVPATFNPIKDQLGFEWDLDARGAIRYGTEYCFSSSHRLTLNGTEFNTPSSSYRQMTKEGEYLLTSTMEGVKVVRRIKIDKTTGTARYVEVFHNPGGTPVTLSVRVLSMLGTRCQTVWSSRAQSVNETLSKQEVGILALQQNANNRPSVLFYLGSAKTRFKPTIQNSNNQQFYFTWNLQVPPRKTVSLVHGVAQRYLTSTPDQTELDKHFTVFESPAWVEDLPEHLQRLLVNHHAGGLFDSGPLLEDVINLATSYDVNPGSSDVLVIDRNTKLTGEVRGEEVSINSIWGEVTVPLTDVLLLQGGAGMGRVGKLYLRNGEILVGGIRAPGLTFTGEVGVETQLNPEDVNLLFFHRNPEQDGKPAPGSGGMVQTYRGDRLAIAESPGRFRGTTAWGVLDVPFSEVRQITLQTNPQPLHRVRLKDGTQLSLIPDGSELELNSTRFGMVKLSFVMVTALSHISPLVEEDERVIAPLPELPDLTPEQQQSLNTARERLRQARAVLREGKLDDAATLAREIQAMEVIYHPLDDTPQLLLDDISRLRGEVLPPMEETDPQLESSNIFGPPQCELLGENTVMSGLALPELLLETASGTINLKREEIAAIQRQEEGEDLTFEVELADRTILTGKLQGNALALQVGEQVWRIPSHHLLSYKQPMDRPELPPEEQPVETPPEDHSTDPNSPPVENPADDPFAP